MARATPIAVREVLAAARAAPAIRTIVFCCFSERDRAVYARVLGAVAEARARCPSSRRRGPGSGGGERRAGSAPAVSPGGPVAALARGGGILENISVAPRILACSSLVLAVLVVACGPRVLSATDAPPLPTSPVVSIEVAPADQTLQIDGAMAATSVYTATGTFEDGTIADISDRVQWSLGDATLGSFAVNQFTSTLDKGGQTPVIAALAGVQGEAALTLRIRQRYGDPGASGLPPDPAAPFTGPADPGRAPALVYPNDGVLLPPNLRLLEIHFQPGAGNTLFAIGFANALTDITVYTRCELPVAGGCIYTPDATVWQWIAETNRGGDELVVTVRGTDDAGTGVGTSPTQHLAFSLEDVKGGIYYWKASGGSSGDSAIMRFDFGNVAQLTAERFVGPEQAGGKCVGCHALSPDGTKMVASAGGWDVEDMLLVDVETGTRVATPAQTAFASWSPDGSKYVGVFAFAGTTTHDLMLFDAAGGSLGTIDVGATAAQSTSHPDWAPDGSRIAFVRAGEAYEGGVNNQRFYRGEIQMVQAQGTGFGSPVTLVPGQAGRNRYYPAFAPDSSLVAFNESTCPTGSAHVDCNADSDPTATLFVTRSQIGATPIALTRANAPGKTDLGTALTSSWPKWAPFEFQRTRAPGSRVMWLTFSSSRNVGLRTPPAGTSGEAATGTWLWMVAIDPDRALADQDPSYPAFYLPFQDATSSNHIAQWTKEIVVLQ